MLDQLSVENLVRQQIALEVGRKIEEITASTGWMEDIESRIIQHVQDRITGRFANIATVPDLIQAVKDSVVTLIDQGRIPGVAEYVDPVKVTQAVDQGVEAFVATVLDNLVMDQHWLSKIQTQVDQRVTQQVLEHLSGIDINTVFALEIDRSMARWKEELQKNFRSCGIIDSASHTQLTLTDANLESLVPVTTSDVTVTNTLTTHNLIVKGVINTDNESWNELVEKMAQEAFAQTSEQWKQDLVTQVLDLARTQGIDFSSISIQGRPLVQDNTLCEHVTHSSLNRVGALQDLVVDGHARLNNTLDVSRQRVGINTNTPEMALSVWDEEVAISLGKLSKQQAYIGTSRPGNLAIGVNRRPALEIDTDLLTTLQALRIQRHRISFATEVPGTSGTRGDLVFNSDPKPNTPFAWVCLGGFKWQPLRSAA